MASLTKYLFLFKNRFVDTEQILKKLSYVTHVLQAIIEKDEAFWVWLLEGDEFWANDKFLSYFKTADSGHQFDNQWFVESVKAAISSQDVCSFSLAYHSGVQFLIQGQAKRLLDSDGGLFGLWGTVCGQERLGSTPYLAPVVSESIMEGSNVDATHQANLQAALQAIDEKERALIDLENKNLELQQTQTKLTSILDSTTDINLLLDKDQKILNFNRRAAESIQYAFGRQPVLGDDFREFTLVDFKDIFAQNFQMALSGAKVSHEYAVPTGGDEVSWFGFQFYPVFDSNGQVMAVSLNVVEIDKEKKAIEKLEATNAQLNTNIEELKQLNERISKSEAALRGLIESQTTYLIRTDLNGNYTFVNEQYKKDFEHFYGTSDLIGKSSMMTLEQEEQIKLYSAMQGLLEDPKQIIKLALNKKKGQNQINTYALWEFTGITNDEGKLTEIQCMGTDITEQKHTERLLQERELYYRSLVESIPDSIFVLSKEGVFLDYKANPNELYVPTDSFLGKNIKEVIPEEVARLVFENINKVFSKKKVAEFSYSLFIQGKKEHYKARAISLGADKVMFVCTNVTRSVDYLNRIESLLDTKERQNQRLANFAHVVSHNLRSHTSNISGLLNLFEQEYPDLYAENTYLKLIKTSSEKLNETIFYLNQVLDLENTEKQNWQFVNLESIVQSVLDSVFVFARDSGVELQAHIEKGLTIRTVVAYLESILLNFLTNSIKYKSDDRESFAKIEAYSIPNAVVILFEDNGLGIDLEQHEKKLFGMFKTFHQHPEAKGVGLFIAKNQIDGLGGSIEVKSQVGVGTVFKVILPQ